MTSPGETDDGVMAVDAISVALASPAVGERRRAVRALEGLGELTEAHVDALFVALGDEDWRIRRDALDIAIAMADDAFLPRVIDGIRQSERVGLRNACIELAATLGTAYAQSIAQTTTLTPLLLDGIGAGDASVVTFLAEIASDEDENLAASAIGAIARVGGAEAEEQLAKLLGVPQESRVIGALDGLRVLRARVDFDTLQPLLAGRLLWRCVVPLLAATEDARAVPWLVRALNGSGELSRVAAVGLAEMHLHGNDQVIVRTLGPQELTQLHALIDRDAAGQAALSLLTARHDARAIAPLLASLAEGCLQPGTLGALRGWGTAATAAVLAHSAPHRAVALELAAELALGDAEAEASVRDALRVAIEHSEDELVVAALRGLAHVAVRDDIEVVVRVALSRSEEVSVHAARTLQSLAIRDREGVAQSIRAVRLERGTAPLAPVLVQVLGEGAKEHLLTGLSSDDEQLRAACALALGRCGPSVVDHLVFALGDEAKVVRIAAIRALGAVRYEDGAAAGLAPLRAALAAGDGVVVAVAAEELASLGDQQALPALMELVDRGGEAAAAAAAAIHRIDDCQLDFDALLERDDSGLVLAVADLLTSSDARWMGLLGHVRPGVRLRAVEVLGARVEEGTATEEEQRALQCRIEVETHHGVRVALMRYQLPEAGR